MFTPVWLCEVIWIYFTFAVSSLRVKALWKFLLSSRGAHLVTLNWPVLTTQPHSWGDTLFSVGWVLETWYCCPHPTPYLILPGILCVVIHPRKDIPFFQVMPRIGVFGRAGSGAEWPRRVTLSSSALSSLPTFDDTKSFWHRPPLPLLNCMTWCDHVTRQVTKRCRLFSVLSGTGMSGVFSSKFSTNWWVVCSNFHLRACNCRCQATGRKITPGEWSACEKEGNHNWTTAHYTNTGRSANWTEHRSNPLRITSIAWNPRNARTSSLWRKWVTPGWMKLTFGKAIPSTRRKWKHCWVQTCPIGRRIQT